MTKSDTELSGVWAVGDTCYCDDHGRTYATLQHLIAGLGMEDKDTFQVVQFHATEVRMYRMIGNERAVPVVHFHEDVYKVMRNRNKAMNITLLTKEMTEVVTMQQVLEVLLQVRVLIYSL